MIVYKKNTVLINRVFKSFVTIMGFFLYLLMISSQSLSFSLSLFSVFSILLIVAFNDKTFTNPVTVFTIFYYPYSTWFSYYSLLSDSGNLDVLEVSVELSYLGLLSFSIVGLFAALFFKDSSKVSIYNLSRKGSLELSAKLIISFSVFLILLAVVEVLFSGASSKREALNASSYLGSLSGYAAVVLTVGMVLLIIRHSSESWPAILFNRYYVTSFIALLAGFLFLGERDFIFRIGFCTLVMYFSRAQNASLPVLFTILFALVMVLPITQAAKGLLLPGASFSLNYSLADIFYGEFISASRNVYMLVEHGVDHSYAFLISDFYRAFVPFSHEVQSSGAWYNNVYRVDNFFSGVAGWGFSLVAAGYLVDGKLGVVVIMSLVSFVIHFCYLNRLRSVYWFSFYVVSLSVCIYTIRSDMANYLSQIFKIGGVSVLCFWILSLIFKRRNNCSVIPMSE